MVRDFYFLLPHPPFYYFQWIPFDRLKQRYLFIHERHGKSFPGKSSNLVHSDIAQQIVQCIVCRKGKERRGFFDILKLMRQSTTLRVRLVFFLYYSMHASLHLPFSFSFLNCLFHCFNFWYFCWPLLQIFNTVLLSSVCLIKIKTK